MGWNNLSIPQLQRLHRWHFGMNNWFHLQLYNWCNYISMLGWKLIHVSKRGHRNHYFQVGILFDFLASGCNHGLMQVHRRADEDGLSIFHMWDPYFSVFMDMVWAFMYATWEHLQAGLDYFMSFLKSGRYSSLVFIVAKPPISDSTYRKTSYISRTLLGNKIVDNSDVVGASPVGAAPTTSSFST